MQLANGLRKGVRAKASPTKGKPRHTVNVTARDSGNLK